MSQKETDKTGWPERPHFPEAEFTAQRANEAPLHAIFAAIMYVGDQLARIAAAVEEINDADSR